MSATEPRLPLLPRTLARLRLSTQLAAASALLVGAVVLASFAALGMRVQDVAQGSFAEQLGHTQETLLRLEQRRREQLLRMASLVGEAPTLRAAIEVFRVEGGTGAAPADSVRRATVQRAATDQIQHVPSDLLVITDAEGRVIAATARMHAPPAIGARLGDVLAVRQAIDPAAPVDSGNVGVAKLGDAYYNAAAAPIELNGYTIGAVILGEVIDQAFVHELQGAFDGEIVVTAGGRPIGSTLQAAAVPAVVAAASGPARNGVRTVALEEREYVVAPYVLGVAQRGEPVTLHLLHSPAGAVRHLTQAVGRDFLLFGIVALLVAAALAGFGARALLAPLHSIIHQMRRGPRAGALAPVDVPPAAPREIRWLADSYGRLVDALAEEREAVRRHTSELEAANAGLTEQIRERMRIEGELHEREEQLRQAQKLEALGTLAGGVAHDFNNLLTVISGFTQLALARTPADSPTRADLVQVKDAAHRAGELTAQLLAFGRKQVLRPRVLDLNDVITGVEGMLRRVLDTGVELTLVLEPALARVHADPGQLEQVLMNLAINARDAMPDGGVLTIVTENAPEGVVLSVRDTGTGMDAATRERIFEPFFTTKEVGRGTGLGLATVYGIVQQSGGTIAVETAPGAGALFRIVLPAVAAPATGGAAPMLPEAGPRGTETILLVEDEEPVRQLARRVLEDHGYVVLAAASGAEALALADREPGLVHLLVSDVVMPHMTGRELARRLHASRPETRVLFMSGHSEDAVARHGDLGFDAGFLRKPFSPAQLARAVREILDAEVLSAR